MTEDKEPIGKTKVESAGSSDFDDVSSTSSTHLSSERILSSSPSSPEPGIREEYDREAIFHQLASLTNSDSERQMILDIIGLKISSAKSETKTSTESAEISESEMSAEDRQKSVVDGLRETLKAVPDSVLRFFPGWFRPGDCGRPAGQKPDWLDMDKLRRGQKFTQDYMFPVFYCELLGLLCIFSFKDGLKPLIISGNSDTPYTAFRRYQSAALRMRRWYTQDSWTKGTDAWKDILVVRAMHAASRRRLESSPNEEIDAAAIIPDAWCPAREILLKDFSETCAAPVPGQCPYLAGWNNPNRPKGVNQIEMVVTQWSFVGLITLYPKSLGIHDATEEDLEAYCHLWRSIGYQLGIEDEYNLCRGTLQEIRERNRDILETWIKPNLRDITPEWEHMGRSLITGMTFTLPFANYETTLLHLFEIIGLRMPRFYASLSYRDWIMYNFLSTVFNYGTKVPGMRGLLNTIMKQVIDRFEKFTPDEYEAIQIKFSNYNGNSTETKGKSAAVNS